MEKVFIDDFKNFKFISNLQFSPNNEYLACFIKNEKDNGYNSGIYISKDRKEFTLLADAVGSFFTWFENDHIIFSANRENKKIKYEKSTSFYKISIWGGEAKKLFKIEMPVMGIEILDDEKYLVYGSYDNDYPDLMGKTKEEKAEILKEYEKTKDYEIVDELPFNADGKGFVNKIRNRLFLFDGKDLNPITSNLYQVTDYKLSPCKKYIVYTGSLHNDMFYRDVEFNLYDIEKNEIKKLHDRKYYISFFEIINDTIIFAGTTRETYGNSENPDFYSMDLDGNINLITKFGNSIGTNPGSDSRLGGGTVYKAFNGDIYFTSLDNFTTDIFKLDMNYGKTKKITDFKGSIDFFDISDEGIYFGGFIDDKLMEIYSYIDGNLKQITNLNESFYKNKFYSKPEHFNFYTKAENQIDGWIMFPIDFDENKKYPCILNIHGGPKTAYGDIYFHEMQYFASEGYIVIFCNPFGSDGKGNDFAYLRGEYGNIDYDNIMEFVDEAIKKYPQIDEDKMGVTGGSYGGYMTNWIIGHTPRFKAAAAQRSIASWYTLTFTSDIGYDYDIDQAKADALTEPEAYFDMSPIKYMKNATTPLLLLHSVEDFRCPISEAVQMFVASKLKGNDTRLCYFYNESHGLSRMGKPSNRVKRLEEIVNWMDKYLK